MGNCVWCGKEFEGEEIDAPMAYQGDIICDGCYHEKEFPCAVCEEYMTDEDVRHFAINEYDEDDFGEKGIYEILHHPFFVDNMITQTIFDSAVKKISEIEDDSNSGYICNYCSDKIEEKTVVKED